MQGMILNTLQSEIWLVNLSPVVGSEIDKLRPCIIVSDDAIGKLPLKTVVPVTGWNDSFEHLPWMIKLEPNEQNCLSKPSSADAFQVKNISTARFDKKIGAIDENTLFLIHSTIVKTLKIRYRLAV